MILPTISFEEAMKSGGHITSHRRHVSIVDNVTDRRGYACIKGSRSRFNPTPKLTCPTQSNAQSRNEAYSVDVRMPNNDVFIYVRNFKVKACRMWRAMMYIMTRPSTKSPLHILYIRRPTSLHNAFGHTSSRISVPSLAIIFKHPSLQYSLQHHRMKEQP